MKLRLLCVGKLSESYLRDGAEEYISRIRHYAPLTVLELKEEKTGGKKVDPRYIRDREGERILEKIGPESWVIVLAEEGGAHSSEALAGLLERHMVQGTAEWVLVIGTGRSDRQVQSVADAVHLGLKKEHNTLPLGVEGMKEGRWVLIDYGDVMVHVFQEPVREFYDLDGLWSEAGELPIPDEYHWERRPEAK